MIRHAPIREAHPGDARDIADVHVRSWRATYRNLLPGTYLRYLHRKRMTGSMMNGLLDPQYIYLVAEDPPEQVVAYICGGPERTGNPIYRGEIYELYVLPDFQRRDIGRRLMSALARRFHQRRYYAALVWVLAGNPNRRFYERIGGLYLQTKTISFAGKRLQAAAYGWIDITLAVTP